VQFLISGRGAEGFVFFWVGFHDGFVAYASARIMLLSN
jgi:hypothetical protein